MFIKFKQFICSWISKLSKSKKFFFSVYIGFIFFVIFLKFYSGLTVFEFFFNVKVNTISDLIDLFYKGYFYISSTFFFEVFLEIVCVFFGWCCIFFDFSPNTFEIFYENPIKYIDTHLFNIHFFFEDSKNQLNNFFSTSYYSINSIKTNFITIYSLFECKIKFYNLPIFFYFYMLFILTTVFSLFYLSFLGFYGVFIINLISILLFWISSIISFNDYFVGNTITIVNLGKWFVFDANQIVSFEFLIDSVSYSFFFLTLTISVFVYMFTFSYFRYEPNIERFTLLLNSFVISMICLVFSGNCFVLFLGWELIGLTSFFLINFWSTKISVLKSAFKAFSFNKLSDVSLFIFLLLILYHCGDANISVSNEKWNLVSTQYINILDKNFLIIDVLSFFLLISICIKSAQFGFHLWLPDSMEAPVPASALIHSATLVSAGIFLLLRFTYLFELSVFNYFIALVGSFTAFYGGISSVFQSDSKRILAYSTISHCGFLMACFVTIIPEYTVLYLYVHGFFKAAIFLCLGNIIRFFRNVQDIRRMGNVWKYLPFECFASFVCLINLSGLPFTLGFYIKHLLLLGTNIDTTHMSFVLMNLLGGAIFGIIYSFRFFYYIFFDFKKSKKIVYNDANRDVLKSFFYTNSSVSSNLIITAFVLTSYIVIIYLYFIFLNKNSFGNGFNSFSIQISKYEEFSYLLKTFVNNISYFNWFVLLLISLLMLVTWRIAFFNNQINVFYCLSFIFYLFVFIKF